MIQPPKKFFFGGVQGNLIPQGELKVVGDLPKDALQGRPRKSNSPRGIESGQACPGCHRHIRPRKSNSPRGIESFFGVVAWLPPTARRSKEI